MIEAPSRASLAILIKKITGLSCNVPTLDGWANQGCPMTPNSTGGYTVGPVIRWLYQRTATNSEKTWTEQFARETTLILADQRMTDSGELVTVEMFGPLALETHAELSQVVHEVSSQGSDRSAARQIAMKHGNEVLSSVRAMLSETAKLFSEAAHLDDDTVVADLTRGEESEKQSTELRGRNERDWPAFLQ
jgi:prolyl oligopeptidase PreP (S9A serine peptidase family)